VTIGPQDRNVPGSPFPGALRASDADRERMIDALKTAFVQGRLTSDELSLRTGRALEARTYAELAAVTASIPTGRAGTRFPQKPAPASTRKPVNKKLVAGCAAVIVLPAPIWAVFLTFYGGFVIMCMLAVIAMAVSDMPWPSRHKFTGPPTGANVREE
jgi:hypothetical protein